jgi:hypothetical protein
VPGLIRFATDQDLLLWTSWQYGPTDEDRAWDWWAIYLDCGTSRGRYECYAAWAQNELQGLAVLDLKKKRTRTGSAITLDYLSTNPANRTTARGLKHIGVALFAVAIFRSREAGARGAVWLESLPGAAGFYGALGMIRQPRKSAEGNFIYTLDATTAEHLLEEIKRSSIVVPP